MRAFMFRLALALVVVSLVLTGAAFALGAVSPTDEIAFDAPSENGRDLFLLDAGRGQFVRLTHGGGRSAAWSPDGEQLAYIGPTDEAGGEGLYILRPGSTPRLLRPVTVLGMPRALDWSPAGDALVFTDSVDGAQGVFTLDLAAGTVRRLTEPRGHTFAPTWSPGGLIAFSWSPVANAEVYTLPASQFTLIDSHSTVPRPQRITDSMYTDSSADWSPDGRWLAFVSDREGSSNIYRMRPDGSELEALRITPAYEGDPSWTPDGERLAIVSNATGEAQLAVWTADGATSMTLPAYPGGHVARPAWRPPTP